MNRRTIIALGCLFATPLAAQGPDTTFWMQRPEIREIRAIVGMVQRDIDAGRLRRTDTTVSYCVADRFDLDLTIFRDSRGRIRRIITSFAGEDHGERDTYTYDAEQRLRFAFGERAAVNGSEADLRAYWRADGSLILRDTRPLKGEGYPWNEIEPIFDPSAVIASTCDATH